MVREFGEVRRCRVRGELPDPLTHDVLHREIDLSQIPSFGKGFEVVYVVLVENQAEQSFQRSSPDPCSPHVPYEPSVILDRHHRSPCTYAHHEAFAFPGQVQPS